MPPASLSAMDINRHPAVQPVLYASNVKTLVRYIDADKPGLTDKGGNSLDYLDGWRDAQAAALRAVRMMWDAAVIAARARALDIADSLAEADDLDDDTDGYPVSGDALNVYRQTAGDLLALAVRLDMADQDDIDRRAAALDSLNFDDDLDDDEQE